MMTRKARNLFVLVVCSISFRLDAQAQDAPYSTDSLMAAFDKSSQTSLKGSEITLTGVITEIKKSRVVFKSLGNDKVICSLVSPIAIEGHPVGSSLTVVGKVRGRGMLGNVTLDQCNLPSTNVASAEPAPVESTLEQPSEEPIAAVEQTTPATVAAAGTNAIPAGYAQARKSLPLAAANEIVSANAPEESNGAITTSSQPHEVVQENSNSPKTLSRGVFLASVAVLLGIGAFLAFVKLRPAIAAGLRPPSFPTTDGARRAALQALLLKEKKQK